MRKLVATFLIVGLLLTACGSTQPQISVERESFSFGEVVNGQIVEKDLRVWNSGNGSLVIDAVSTSCGCTTAGLESMTLAPGESTTLHIEFDSGAHGPEEVGELARQIFIASNDPVQGELVIEFSATVLPSNAADG